jgi:Zn-finger domain-containing protein
MTAEINRVMDELQRTTEFHQHELKEVLGRRDIYLDLKKRYQAAQVGALRQDAFSLRPLHG